MIVLASVITIAIKAVAAIILIITLSFSAEPCKDAILSLMASSQCCYQAAADGTQQHDQPRRRLPHEQE